eukprot:scaffold25219_cov104-Skeletonema_dohrnii-CCMP3373.AAC.2
MSTLHVILVDNSILSCSCHGVPIQSAVLNALLSFLFFMFCSILLYGITGVGINATHNLELAECTVLICVHRISFVSSMASHARESI